MKKNNRNYNVNNGNSASGGNNKGGNRGNSSFGGNNDFEKQVKQDVQSDLNKFGNMSQNQLMQELLNVAKEEKQKGNLTPEMLDTFYQTLTPSMNAQQRSKMNGLIKELKK